MTPQEMHAQMLDAAQAVALPKHYRNDLLVHDLTALHEMEAKGLTTFWWRLRECGTQFSAESEHMARMGWNDEQAHCYFGDLATGKLRLLHPPASKGVR
jgi:hypothetical protein